MVVLCFFIIIACIFDYYIRKIPNILIIAIVISGIIRAYLYSGYGGIIFYLIKTCSVITVLYPLFKIGGIGAGDVKLFGVCSGYFDQNRILYFLFFSMLVAAIFSIIKMVKRKNFKKRFLIMSNYIYKTISTGEIGIYPDMNIDKEESGLCLSGPVLCSVLLHIGGVW